MTVPLAKPWRALDRAAIERAPERYGVYEIGRGGDVRQVEWGVLKFEIKDALAYADGDQVRWQETGTRERAQEMAETHREKLERD